MPDTVDPLFADNAAATAPAIIGVDFTSAPSRRKPITIAVGRMREGAMPVLQIERLDACEGWLAFEQWLSAGRWIAAFDFPFGLPKAFVDALGWATGGPEPWTDITRRVEALSRPELVGLCRAYCAARPVGAKFAHRATDATAGCSPSMKWVNPPVVLMLHAGAPRLMNAGVTLPGLREHHAENPRPTGCAAGSSERVALEGYPGLLARDVLGRMSYKSDDRRRNDSPRRDARRRLVEALEGGRHRFGLPVDFGPVRDTCIDEPMADRLDAVLCAVQAGWAWQRRNAGYGLPRHARSFEGWIVGA
jgi:hypothetical protein